eukprot:CAMPEP_0185745498 /NCGR_PEP_ID=MMETSP1174-20130828/3850_1 /TAXON_ID=35687 /ORGANISM="Dictyocha speculum, Strain CCMP1381" /LENGTH=184 /DNA_ID=CAMNT_0028419541 /DNA_START=89 /DNA_END=643 /DNA_ORIENTATION=+
MSDLNPWHEERIEEELFPPTNFSMVEKGIFRSGFPTKRNFPFLKRLGLCTVLTVVLEDYPASSREFYGKNGIKLLQFGMEGNKEPFRSMPIDALRAALAEVMDVNNHPILIHCNEGKHRTGCIVGCLRRARGWALSPIFDEYILFAQRKARMVDQRFIELFELSDDTHTLIECADGSENQDAET